MPSNLQNRIRERAYEIWNAGGQLHGQAEQHWLTAEREILAQTAAEICTKQPGAIEKPVRQTRRPVTNLRQQPRKAAKAS
jgi:hypothetical protein